jgi:glycosyltransferase involved in cell wall biosynthesis
MRVTLLSKALVVGAYQRKCELIAAHTDVDLTVLVPPTWDSQALERAHTTGYDLRVIPIRFNGNFHLHHYPALAAELKRAQPDVFHIDEEPYNFATWDAVRCATHLRDASHVIRTLFFSWQNINRMYPPPFGWMERDVLRKADAAIAGSDESKAVWQAKGFAREISVIPQFGVDEGMFAPSPLPSSRWGEGVFRIGYAGRFVREKGLDLLLHAVAQLPPQVKVILAGSGDQATALRELAQQLGIGERVKFCAPIPSTGMPSFYQQLDAFVLPSRTLANWKEQFGRVLIEAMACGVPVISARSGEIPHTIGDAGLLFDEGDVDGLRHHLSELMTRPELRTELAQKGRARVLEKFTMKRVADQTVEVYRRLTHV